MRTVIHKQSVLPAGWPEWVEHLEPRLCGNLEGWIRICSVSATDWKELREDLRNPIQLPAPRMLFFCGWMLTSPCPPHALRKDRPGDSYVPSRPLPQPHLRLHYLESLSSQLPRASGRKPSASLTSLQGPQRHQDNTRRPKVCLWACCLVLQCVLHGWSGDWEHQLLETSSLAKRLETTIPPSLGFPITEVGPTVSFPQNCWVAGAQPFRTLPDKIQNIQLNLNFG